jgi:plastocyanin
LGFTLSDSESTAAKVGVVYTLSIVPPPLAITTTSIAAGEVEKTYSQQLTAVNGTPPYTWSITAGQLPKGLVFNGNAGFISGKPVQFVSKTTISFKVVDAGNPQGEATASLEIAVASGLSITTASIPDATVAKEYSATLAGTGGLKPYKWTIASGALPNGITLDKATGELSGSTAGAGVFKFSVQLEDSEGTPATTTVAYKLTVSEPPPSPTTTKLTSSNASVKVGANVTFTATVSKAGGVPTGTVTFRHGGQSLGTGKLNSKGVATLTTSFSAAGVFHFTAIYNGDATSASSVSNQITQTVTSQ